jgi:salicylate hydroxylase
MSPSPFRVLIVGGGIGGLTLTQGLKKAGVEVAVYERDRGARTDRLQGYRVHLNPTGARALHECLPPQLFDAFVATTGKSEGRFCFLTEQLRELLSLDAELTGARAADPLESHHSVSRITLRQVLLAGLQDVVHFDKKFVKYDQAPEGTVTAFFEDGASAIGDVLVAADGGNSRVRQQYLPHAERIETGLIGIAGKLPLTAATRHLVPAQLRGGTAVINSPKGRMMFLATQEFDHRTIALTMHGIGGNDAAAQEHPGLLFDNTVDYAMWAFATHRQKYPPSAELEELDSSALQELTLTMIADWHPDLRRMVHSSDVSTIALLPIRSSVPVEAWPTTTVTLIGDAIHSMTPMRGIGANIALRDAALLCSNLIAACRGDKPLLEAIGDYEAEMRGYGFAAVRGSLQAARQMTSDSTLGRVAFRTFMRTVNAVPPLKRRIFAGMGEDQPSDITSRTPEYP